MPETARVDPEHAEAFMEADEALEKPTERLYALVELLSYLADLSLGISDRGGVWGVRNRPMHPEVAQLVREELRPAFLALESATADLSNAGAELGELPGRPSDPEIEKLLAADA